MDWTEILTTIFTVCVIPLLGILTDCLVKFIKIKRDEAIAKIDNNKADKYIAMLSDTITTCVVATKQTYVDSLKKDNLFTAEAQKEALNKTLNAVITYLTDDAKDYLTSIYGDLNSFLVSKIEAEINFTK